MPATIDTPPSPAAGASPLPRTVSVDRLASVASLADLVARLGGVPLERIKLHPWPGTATEEDLIAWNEAGRGAPCELVDGTLVEKAPMAMFESRIATILLFILGSYERDRRTIACYDASAINRMAGGNVRMPDVSIYLRDRLKEIYPGGKISRHPKVSDITPDLFVEVLSESNTPEEIDRKQREFFAKGTSELWVVDPAARTVEVRTPEGDPRVLHESETLTSEAVVPGLAINIADWFAEAEEI